MLIIAALNLPYTVSFESEETQSGPGDRSQSLQSSQSLVRGEPEPTEPEAEVPFDFAQEAAEEDQHHKTIGQALNSSSIGSPAMSIADDKASGGESRTIASSAAGTPKGSGSRWDPDREVELLHKISMLTHSNAEKLKRGAKGSSTSGGQGAYMQFSLAHLGSPGDYDTKIERQMLTQDARSNVTHGRSNSVLSMTSIKSKRRNSTASVVTVDDQGVPSFAPPPFKIIPYKGANRGLFNALDSAVEKGQIENYKSVGLTSIHTDALTEETKLDISEELRKNYQCHAVYASNAARKGHYDNYCKEFLWPTFHCLTPDIPRSKAYEENSWGSYVAVNKAVADKIVDAYEPGDTVWIHDYHLMLVPQMVREKLPNAPIGFFLHVAFPSSEVFRSLAYRAELLSGVLASNLIGFHIPEYVQHFKMSLARILAVDISGTGVVETADHDAFITSLPLGIDSKRLGKILAMDDPMSAVQQHRKVIRARWPHQIIIAARDKADPIRGLSQKLRAFNKFLSENPHWANRVVLVQICTSGYSGSGIDTIADKINSQYGDIASGIQPVVLLKQDVKYEQYLALLIEANGFCVTCLRDGMNLTCHEFAESNAYSRMGPLILSEFTGSASVLGSSAILVNPWDEDQLLQAFKACVEMPRWEREQRWRGLRKAVEKHTAAEWATSLTEQITQAWQDEKSRECSKPDIGLLQQQYHEVLPDERRLFLLEAERPSTIEARKWLTEEGGAKINETYQHRSSQENFNHKGGPYYTTRLPLALRELCSDPRNIVYVISPETPDYMERMFRALPGLGLISEFGKYVRMHGDDKWTELTKDKDLCWQEKMKPCIQQLKERNLVQGISIHDSSIIIEFNLVMDPTGEREHSLIGEYMSLINDQYSQEGVGIRTKLEGTTLTLYKNSLGKLRQRAFQHIVDSIPEQIGLTVMANQPYSSDSEDIVYNWADSLKSLGVSKEVITLSVGKHPSLAKSMVEGTNALLNLLHTMRTKEDVRGPRSIRINKYAKTNA